MRQLAREEHLAALQNAAINADHHSDERSERGPDGSDWPAPSPNGSTATPQTS
jgi:hypothetical protein